MNRHSFRRETHPAKFWREALKAADATNAAIDKHLVADVVSNVVALAGAALVAYYVMSAYSAFLDGIATLPF